MGYSTFWSDEPKSAPADYRKSITEPTTKEIDGQTWMFTPETLPEDHPWSDKIEKGIFPDEVMEYLVVAMQYAVHPVSGDLYWDI